MRVCDVDGGLDPKTYRLEGDLEAGSAVTEIDLCLECREAVEELGLVAGIARRVKPRRQRRTPPAAPQEGPLE